MLTQGKEFVSAIKEARIKHGLTQQQVSDLTGVPFRSIQNWELGVRKCPDYVEKMVVTMIEQQVKHGQWEWFEEWIPSTPDHPKECEDCGWRCGKCKTALEDVVGGYWDDPFETPMINYCPNCGVKIII